MLRGFNEQLLIVQDHAVTTGIQKLGNKQYKFTLRKGSGSHLKQRAQKIKAPNDAEAQQRYQKWYLDKLEEIRKTIDQEKSLGPQLANFIKRDGQFDKLGQEEVKLYANTNNPKRVKTFASWRRVVDSLRWVRKNGLLYEGLGEKPLGAITRQDVQEAFAKVRGQYKYNTLHNFKGNLTKVFKLAIEAGILDEDFVIPTQQIDIGPVATIKEQKTSFEASEFMHAVQLIKTLEPHYRLFYSLALGSGMRRGEIMALQLSDFDFEHDLIHINNSTTEMSNKPGVEPRLQIAVKPGTKNGKKRFTKLTQIVKEALQEYLKTYKPTPWTDPTTGKTYELLFTNPHTGYPYTLSTMTSQWQRKRNQWLKEGKIKQKTTLHDLRGSFITYLLVREKVPEITIASMSGHSDPEMIHRVYANPTIRDIEDLDVHF